MPRPEYPNCIMTPEIIHRIRSEQEFYDRDPDRYEQRQSLAEQKQQQETDYIEQQHQHELEQHQINNLNNQKMSEKIYPKGIRTFQPHENAPDFVKGSLIITPSELVKFCDENKNLMRDYNGVLQLRCQLLEGDKGLYVNVDTYGLESIGANNAPVDTPPAPEDDLPF